MSFGALYRRHQVETRRLLRSSGAIVTDNVIDLPDGSAVTVVAEDEGGFDVSPDEETQLLAAIREADPGTLVPMEELLARLPLTARLSVQLTARAALR